MKYFLLLPLLFLLTGFYDGLKTYQKREVLDGTVIVRDIPNPGKKGGTFEAVGVIHGTLDEVTAVLTDYSKYNEFMPNVKLTKIVEDRGDTKVVDYTLGLPLGKKKEYRLELKKEAKDDKIIISWKKLERKDLLPKETIVDTVGSWMLSPCKDKKGYVLALYHVYTDPGHIPTGLGWIVDILTKQSIPNVIKKTRARVEELYYKK